MSSIMLTTDGDIALGDQDLVPDESIVSAVLVSLFCDADAEELQPGHRRGWWADEDDDRPVGSLLWRLDRAKAPAETRALAQDTAEASLRWLVDEGIAQGVTVTAAYDGPDRLILEIEIARGDSRRHQALWDAFDDVEFPWTGGILRLRGL